MVDQDKWFYFAGGNTAKDIEDLRRVLAEIPDEEFVFHVNSAKNDFANWVEGVFQYTDLAFELRKVMERKDTLHVLDKFLRHQKQKDSAIEKTLGQGHAAKDDELMLDAPKEEALLEDHEKAQLSVHQPLERGHAQVEDEKTKIEEELEQIAKNTEPQEPESGRDLSPKEIEHLADQAKFDFEQDWQQIKDKRVKSQAPAIHSKNFIVKEFIYGFALGLIFGLIMLGALMNVNICY